MMLRSFGATDQGKVRSDNQDGFLCEEPLGVFAVADGVGGLAGGAEASGTTLRLLKEFLRNNPPERIVLGTLIGKISEAVAVLGRQIDPHFGIGTTLTLARIRDGRLLVAHVGDSTLFRLRGGKLEKLTCDHTVASDPKRRRDPMELALLGDYHSGALTRCIGQQEIPEIDLDETPIETGDRYLVCTDGVTRMIPAPDLERILASAADPKAAARTFIDESNDRGGIDNATAVVVYVDEA